ncbi:hypothetical protein ACFQVA_41565 [Actinomadura keratinilytica]
MTPGLGLSSGSAPEQDAAGLAGLTRRLGGTTVDVRAAKGHAWEETGGLAALREAGVRVCFVGHSTVLGRPATPRPPPRCWRRGAGEGLRGRGVHRPGPPRADPAADRRPRRAGGRPRQRPGGDPPRLRPRPGAAPPVRGDRRPPPPRHPRPGQDRPRPGRRRRRAGPWIAYAQVKGFDLAAPGTGGHLPLTGARAEWTGEVLAAAGALRAVTVESRAGALAGDLAVLRALYPSSSTTPDPRKETAS